MLARIGSGDVIGATGPCTENPLDLSRVAFQPPHLRGDRLQAVDGEVGKRRP